MCVGHDAMAAVRGQRRHPVLQRQPPRERVTGRGDDHEWPVAEGLNRASLRQRCRQLGEFVAQAAVQARRGVMEALLIAGCRRQSQVGADDESSHAESSQRREQRGDPAEAVVEGWIARKALERLGRLAVEQDHSGDLAGAPNR